MRNLISILMVLALVLTTALAPSVSHAMPHNGLKAEQSHAAEGEHCHHHDEAEALSGKTVHHDKNTSGKCCDKGICKCLGGACHNGLSMIIGNSGNRAACLN